MNYVKTRPFIHKAARTLGSSRPWIHTHTGITCKPTFSVICHVMKNNHWLFFPGWLKNCYSFLNQFGRMSNMHHPAYWQQELPKIHFPQRPTCSSPLALNIHASSTMADNRYSFFNPIHVTGTLYTTLNSDDNPMRQQLLSPSSLIKIKELFQRPKLWTAVWKPSLYHVSLPPLPGLSKHTVLKSYPQETESLHFWFLLKS